MRWWLRASPGGGKPPTQPPATLSFLSARRRRRRGKARHILVVVQMWRRRQRRRRSSSGRGAGGRPLHAVDVERARAAAEVVCGRRRRLPVRVVVVNVRRLRRLAQLDHARGLRGRRRGRRRRARLCCCCSGCGRRRHRRLVVGVAVAVQRRRRHVAQVAIVAHRRRRRQRAADRRVGRAGGQRLLLGRGGHRRVLARRPAVLLVRVGRGRRRRAKLRLAARGGRRSCRRGRRRRRCSSSSNSGVRGLGRRQRRLVATLPLQRTRGSNSSGTSRGSGSSRSGSSGGRLGSGCLRRRVLDDLDVVGGHKALLALVDGGPPGGVVLVQDLHLGMRRVAQLLLGARLVRVLGSDANARRRGVGSSGSGGGSGSGLRVLVAEDGGVVVDHRDHDVVDGRGIAQHGAHVVLGRRHERRAKDKGQVRGGHLVDGRVLRDGLEEGDEHGQRVAVRRRDVLADGGAQRPHALVHVRQPAHLHKGGVVQPRHDRVLQLAQIGLQARGNGLHVELAEALAGQRILALLKGVAQAVHLAGRPGHAEDAFLLQTRLCQRPHAALHHHRHRLARGGRHPRQIVAKLVLHRGGCGCWGGSGSCGGGGCSRRNGRSGF
eukprot:m.90763 g.90763  ORF g.90763 m.90763 type:complete len:603 (-) comp15278_c0_seq2:831-2639(-)